MQILSRISNLIGAFWAVGIAPPPAARQATIMADMPASEVADATNYLRLAIYADFGAGPRFMARGDEWHGGPGASMPSLSWQFRPEAPPQLVYGVLENGTRGVGTPAIAGLTINFS